MICFWQHMHEKITLVERSQFVITIWFRIQGKDSRTRAAIILSRALWLWFKTEVKKTTEFKMSYFYFWNWVCEFTIEKLLSKAAEFAAEIRQVRAQFYLHRVPLGFRSSWENKNSYSRKIRITKKHKLKWYLQIIVFGFRKFVNFARPNPRSEETLEWLKRTVMVTVQKTIIIKFNNPSE